VSAGVTDEVRRRIGLGRGPSGDDGPRELVLLEGVEPVAERVDLITEIVTVPREGDNTGLAVPDGWRWTRSRPVCPGFGGRGPPDLDSCAVLAR
jgi:hypothetical protein